MAGSDEVENLRNHLVGAVQRALRMCNGFAVLWRDDTAGRVLVALAKEMSDVPFAILHVGEPGLRPTGARLLAKKLGVDLVERYVVTQELSRARQAVARSSVEVAPTVARYAMALGEAKHLGGRLLLADGALGPMDPFAPAETTLIEQLAADLGVQVRMPYRDKGVLPYLGRLLEQDKDPSRLLDELANRLGVLPVETTARSG